MQPSSTVPAWINIAESYLGLHEGTSLRANPRVLKFFREAGHSEVKNDHLVPWCAAFAGAVLHEAGLKGTGSLLALSYSSWGVPLSKPIYGCIGAKVRHGGGHVCFILGETGDHYICLGGNQGDKVCIELISKAEFVALRWPKEVPIPADPHPLLTAVPHANANLSEK